MMKKHCNYCNKGQSILEYALLIAVVIAVLLIMQVFIKRGYQGNLKESADRMGEQYSPSQSTIYKHSNITDIQTVTEESGTNTTASTVGLSAVLGAVNTRLGTAANLTSTVDKGVYSYTSRTGGTLNTTEKNEIDKAETEAFNYTAQGEDVLSGLDSKADTGNLDF